jgi:hypothetical protein
VKPHARALEAIERLGIVLVYPLDDRSDPPSLWKALHPRSKMRWDWAETADPRVVDLWHLRENLARSGDVAYAKWFRGRATFFSKPVFHALLGALSERGDLSNALPREATEILELLREHSPRSTKEIRAAAELRGKPFERIFQHAMKALWARLLVVGVGEVEDGAFPSLAVAATEAMFEDLWLARGRVPEAARRALREAVTRSPALERELGRSLKAIASPTPAASWDDLG